METRNYMTLYQREGCPFCQLVRKKLTLLQIPVLSIPVEEDGDDRKALIELSGQNEVPVLVDGDTVIIGSGKILDYLDDQSGLGPKKGPMPSNTYGLSVTVEGDYQQILEKTTAVLKEQGFGVLTEIDVKATLKKKLDVDVPRHLILGACNPGFAHRVMTEEPEISLLLPCNVTVREIGSNRYLVSAVNPVKLLAVVGREDLIPVAREVKDKLSQALNRLAA